MMRKLYEPITAQFRPKIGDIVGFTALKPVSIGINLGTFGWPTRGLSHIGIIGEVHGDPLVYESTTFGRPACQRSGKQVDGVQAHRWEDLKDFDTARLWHIPLSRELYQHEKERLQNYLDSMIGIEYDMIGAIRSGGFVYRMINKLLRPQDTTTMFCSEFVATALKDAGVLQTRNTSALNPNRLYRVLRRKGIVERKLLVKNFT